MSREQKMGSWLINVIKDKKTASLWDIVHSHISFIIILSILSTYSVSFVYAKNSSVFGIFPAESRAEEELEKIIQNKNIDLALANYLIVEDIPEFHNLDRETYFNLLNENVWQARTFLSKNKNKIPSDILSKSGLSKNNFAFCSAVLNLGTIYQEQFQKDTLSDIEMKNLYSNPDNLFLAGLLRTSKGSCVSMPMLYLVMGRKLGYPIHLVSIGQHNFVRWQQLGYRMNIETTVINQIVATPDDSVYLKIENIKQEDIKDTNILANLTDLEVIAKLLFIRSCYYMVKGKKFIHQAYRDAYRANILDVNNPKYQKHYVIVKKMLW